MTDTKQFVIMQRLTVLLEGITPANGYDYDLTGHVYRGKSVFGANETPPFISILESLRPDPAPLEAGSEKLVREEDWEILIQGWAKTSELFPTDDLYNLKGAIEHRLARVVAVDGQGSPVFPDDYRLGRLVSSSRGGLITGARIGPGVVRAATPQTGGVAALYLPVIIRYIANVSDPWALS
jgi:hypothetical protein